MRQIIAMLEVDESAAIAEDMGTIEYLSREFGWLESSDIFLGDARILDNDDPADANAIELANRIFEGE